MSLNTYIYQGKVNGKHILQYMVTLQLDDNEVLKKLKIGDALELDLDLVKFKEMTKPSIKELFQKYDKPIAVLGGGPTLPEDIKKLPEGCLTISCNHYALDLLEPDFMAFLDNPGINKLARMCAETEGPIKVTKWHAFTDYSLDVPFEDMADTGIFAAWLGCYLTSGPVYLCGMGLRQQGEATHFNTTEVYTSSNLAPKLGRWLLAWVRFYRPERIKVVSGPLSELVENPPYVNKQIQDLEKTDKDIIVMGTDPCLIDDLKKFKLDEFLKIAIEGDKRITEKPDYFVFLSDPERDDFGEYLIQLDTEKISFQNNKFTDYFTSFQSPMFKAPAHLAVWIASYITTGTVYLAGFNIDMPAHWENGNAMWGGPPPNIKEEQWREVCKLCDNKKIVALSGGLSKIFPTS